MILQFITIINHTYIVNFILRIFTIVITISIFTITIVSYHDICIIKKCISC